MPREQRKTPPKKLARSPGKKLEEKTANQDQQPSAGLTVPLETPRENYEEVEGYLSELGGMAQETGVQSDELQDGSTRHSRPARPTDSGGAPVRRGFLARPRSLLLSVLGLQASFLPNRDRVSGEKNALEEVLHDGAHYQPEAKDDHRDIQEFSPAEPHMQQAKPRRYVAGQSE